MIRTLAALPVVLVLGASWTPAEAAADPVTCHGVAATIVGTPGKDVIKGTTGPDVIAALGGDDVVRSGGGDDLVCGGPGRDELKSYRGSDELRGGPGTDRIEGLSPKPSRVYGGPGADLLFLSVTDDPGYVLDGGAGDDIGDLSRHPGERSDTALDINRRAGTFVRQGVRTGTFLGIEQLGVDGAVAYRYAGTGAPDLLTVSGGDFPFTATTYGGDDVVVSAGGDDVIDTGRGDDRVDAGSGDDECVGAEHQRGCETVTP